MQYRNNKWLGLLLALLMLVSLLPVAAMADDGEQLDQTPGEEVVGLNEGDNNENNEDEVPDVAFEGSNDDDDDDDDGDEEEVVEETTPVTYTAETPVTLGATDGDGEGTTNVASVTTTSGTTTTTTNCGTLQEAFTAAENATGAVTVTLLKDIQLTDTVNIGTISNLTFDGGNFTISMDNANKDMRVLSFNQTKSPVIKNLTVSATAKYAIVLDQCESSELNNVKVTGEYLEWNGTKVAVNFLNLGGGKIVNCNICEVFKNAAALVEGSYDYRLTIENSTIGELYVNTPSPATATYSDPKAVIASGNNTIGTVICADATTFRVSSDIVSAATAVKVTVTDATSGSKSTVEPVAELDGVQYTTLAAAVEAAVGKESATIKLLRDVTDSGVVFEKGAHKNLTIDFNGKTFTIGAPMVGSVGTESNGFQIKRDNKVTLKNGAIKCVNITEEGKKPCKHLIQNYSDLTLENIALDGTGSTAMEYVLSNCFGNIQIIGSTSITAPSGAVAFDVYDWTNEPAYKDAAPTVTVNTTGTITGVVELSGGEGTTGGTLKILAGNIVGTIDPKLETSKIIISGGTFSEDVKAEWCADGFRPVKNTDGTYGVTDQPEPTPTAAPTATPAATATPVPVKQAPKTGDEANVALWLVLATMSALGVAVVVHRKKEN